MRYETSDTIAAISTALSESGISIIRISGPDSLNIADKIFNAAKKNKRLSEEKTHTIHYGFIHEDDTIIDEVLVSVMRAPKTFTAEDTVEINCHGGIYVTRRILDLVLKSGARCAMPGEFTKRAFLNGRIDLSQAEAVTDLIQAKNEFALTSSIDQLKGSVKEAISGLRSGILYEMARLESALDDPEHYSLAGFSESLNEKVLKWNKQLEKLINTYDDGRMLKEGIKTVIAGKPNVGKSSIMNAVLGQERVIVTKIPGTTRDTITESVNIQGLNLLLTDTAGIRETEDLAEKIGVQRSRTSLEEADLVIFVTDISSPLSDEDYEIAKLLENKKCLVLLNKSDLEHKISEDYIKDIIPDAKIIQVSARTKSGIDEISEIIREMFFSGKISYNDELYITSARHRDALRNTLKSLKLVLNSIENRLPEDFYSVDLMDACEYLGEITGDEAGEDLINEIFEKFCMGK